jgi:3-hydroxyisobutyrate dehydrogenase
MSQEIGIIGVGKMGAAMWRCLAAAGTTATVYDTFAPSAEALAEAGAVVAATPAELTAAVDVVILSLPNSGDVEGVVADIVSALRAGVVVIDTTSGEPAISRRVAETVAATGAAYLDAGVSGGPPGAEAGTLKIMVGGDATAFEHAQPVLDILGGRIWHCGGPGTGHAMKTALNLSNQGRCCWRSRRCSCAVAPASTPIRWPMCSSSTPGATSSSARAAASRSGSRSTSR